MESKGLSAVGVISDSQNHGFLEDLLVAVGLGRQHGPIAEFDEKAQSFFTCS